MASATLASPRHPAAREGHALVRADSSAGATRTASAGATRTGSHAARLLAALGAIDSLPVLADVRRELLDRAQRPGATPAALVPVVSSDIGLTAAVLRAAGKCTEEPPRGVAGAVEVLGLDRTRKVAEALTEFSPFDGDDKWDQEVSRFRMHALAVARMASRLGGALSSEARDEIEAAALLHDVGKLVLARMDGDRRAHAPAETSRSRQFVGEREWAGVDHTMIGGVVGRRWGLADGIVGAIERHHAPDASGVAALVKTADLLVHYLAGERVSWTEIAAAGAAAGLPREPLAEIVRALPGADPVRTLEHPPQPEPCPLSRRQLQMVRGLARGLQYKQIAQELGLTASTVRSHVHQAYQRAGATDRGQMVLLAATRGWISPAAHSA